MWPVVCSSPTSGGMCCFAVGISYRCDLDACIIVHTVVVIVTMMVIICTFLYCHKVVIYEKAAVMNYVGHS